MISLNEVKQIHRLAIAQFGGADGIRDLEALESALARPFQTFDGAELHKGTLPKAAALLESILINHPFIDGNKRTGYLLLRLFLLGNGIDIIASQNEKYNFIVKIASGNMNFEEIVHWLMEHTSE